MRTFVAVALFFGLTPCFGSLDPQEVVARIQTQRFLIGTVKFGTAWCLDPNCLWMVTNYHVLKATGTNVRVNGERVEASWLATGANDDGARLIPTFIGKEYKYTFVRDLALLKMAIPMSQKGMHGVRLFTGGLRHGENATIYSYPNGHFTRTKAIFDSTVEQGMLHFRLATPLAQGASGGLILNDQDEALGVVFALDASRSTAYAVPMWSIADFLEKTDVKTHATLFPNGVLRPVATTSLLDPEREDLVEEEAPTQQPMALASGHFDPIPALPVTSLRNLVQISPPGENTFRTNDGEEDQVRLLRTKAAQMMNQMTNFIATQTLAHADKSTSRDEVRIIDGEQVFVRGNGIQRKEVPIPRNGLVPGAEWLNLPSLLAPEHRLSLHYLGERFEGATRIRVFQYRVPTPDALCIFRVRRFAKRVWRGAATDCYGQVWTDAENNILQISRVMNLPKEAGLQSTSIVVVYGWIKPPLGSQRLVPAAMLLSARGHSGYFAESFGTFSSYQLFASKSKIVTVSVTTKIVPN